MTGHPATIEHLNIAALSVLPDDAPVTMLNLMRFRSRSLDGNGSGWDAYLRYSALTIKLIKAQAMRVGANDASRKTAPARCARVPPCP